MATTGAKSDYLENAMLNAVLRGVSFTSPSAVYCALYTAAPSDAGGGTEVAGNGYTRKQVSFGAAAAGVCLNDVAVAFPVATGSWGTVTHWGIFDALSGGNLLYWGDLDSPDSQAVNVNEQFSFAVGQLSITET